MSIDNLCLGEWKDIIDEYKSTHNIDYVCAYRADNSILSTAIHSGGCFVNGHEYVCVSVRRNLRDWSSKMSWLIESNVVNFAKKRIAKKDDLTIHSYSQGELL